MPYENKTCKSYINVQKISDIAIGQSCQFYVPYTNSDGYSFLQLVTTTPIEAYAINGNLLYVETKNTLYILRKDG